MTVNDAATTVQLSPLTPRTLGPNRPAVAANSPPMRPTQWGWKIFGTAPPSSSLFLMPQSSERDSGIPKHLKKRHRPDQGLVPDQERSL